MSNEIEKHPAYRRVLLKISGEALVGEQSFGIDVKVAHSVAEEIKQVHNLGVEVAVVVGGGNIFRGLSKSAGSMDRSSADYIGMLATVMNAVVLQDALERTGIQTRVLSAIDIPEMAEPFIRRRAIRHLEKGRIVIFAAGTGKWMRRRSLCAWTITCQSWFSTCARPATLRVWSLVMGSEHGFV